MKKTLRYLVAAVLALCMMQAFALADAPITVQLDGENVVFTDAQPQIVSDRTFLPVRAVFEAMGATVDFKDGVVTAVRGGTTVNMTIGSTAASVTKDGKTQELTMDVAPFIDPALSRTYVPVRFAAQALGANVGWDGAKRTVIIVDAEKQLAAALEGKSFTYLDKLSAYSEKYAKGIWNSELTARGELKIDAATAAALSGSTAGTGANVTGTLNVPMTVTAKGVTQDGLKADVTEKLTVDLTPVKDLLALSMASGSEADGEKQKAETEALIKKLSTDGVSVRVRMDMTVGKLYVNADLSALGKELTETLGMDKDTWLALDVNSMGMDVSALLAQQGGMDYKAMLLNTLPMALNGLDMNDAEKSCAAYVTALKTMVTKLSDEGFTKNGDVCSTTIEQKLGGASLKLSMALTMKNDAVTAYGADFAMDTAIPGMGKMDLGAKMTVNEQDKLTGTITVDVAGMITGSFDLTGSYVKGTTAPQTEPPAGAKLVDLMDKMGSLPGLDG